MKNDRTHTRRRPAARFDRAAGRHPATALDAPGCDAPGLDRRDFLKVGALGVAAGAVTGCSESGPGQDALARAASVPGALPAPPAHPLAAPAIDQVRIGYVGVGGMGTAHVRNLVRIDGCVITAVCDIREAHAERAADIIEEAGHPRPALYTNGETDFERLCAEADLDLVYNATPWRFHVPICVAAMENGKHAATEVPAAYTLEDCWKLVETAERTGRHCAMMENVNYGRAELLCLNLVRQGLLGEILHAECGYLHDLRGIKFADEGEGLWRRDHSWTRNGNLYPTHGLGPVANCMDINRGDRFATLVSMSSPSRGLQEWAAANYPDDHPKRAETFALGDVNGSLIQTALGKTIYVAHDTNLPRPTTVSTRSRARAASSRVIPIACTSKAAVRRTGGRKPRPITTISSTPVARTPGGFDRRGPRRHGLHGGLSPHQVPARGSAARHERVRRGGAERRVRAVRDQRGERERAGGVS